MTRRRRSNAELDAAARAFDGPYHPYDILKELVVAIAVVSGLVLGLTILFSSPDEKPSTIAQWSKTMPVDFVTSGVAELDGSSAIAGYGPPYNHAASGQHAAFIHLQKWLGVSHPIDTAKDFVIAPLQSVPSDPSLKAALAGYQGAPAKTQAAWTTAYSKALSKAAPGARGTVTVPSGNYGPVPVMMNALLGLAQSGGLDGQLLASRQFYETDYTKPLLFMADGGLLVSRATQQHLIGTQWGIMNETGSYPGQSWLWLYTFWYQIKPFSSSTNADLLVLMVMATLSLIFILTPFIPGLRTIPRALPIYKLIWRDHYRSLRAPGPPQSGST